MEYYSTTNKALAEFIVVMVNDHYCYEVSMCSHYGATLGNGIQEWHYIDCEGHTEIDRRLQGFIEGCVESFKFLNKGK